MIARRPLGTGPAAPARDVAAVIEASRYVRHGTTMMGGAFTACRCPKEPCGGVAPNAQTPDCPEHGHGRAPAQRWHWASECPGRH